MAHHDPAYKLLFSHPQMVRDLLAGFVREDWTAQLDYDTLEKVGSSYVSDDLRTRESDVVWRVRWGRRWIYIYLLLEFQSRPDRHMAVRMLAYVSLLYQDLIRSRELPNGLPPVLPIVLYNGAARWRAAKNVSSLIQRGPPALEAHLPQMRYLLIEERQQHEAGGSDNLVSALFRLEHSRTRDDMKEALDALIARLPRDAQSSLRRAFSVWLEDSIMPRVQADPTGEIKDLKEIRSMLSETIHRWKMEFRREGLRAGRKLGHQQGLEKGLEEGRQEGLETGLQKGLQKGLEKGLEKGLKKGLKKGLEKGLAQGHIKGLRTGKEQCLARVLQKRFGELPHWAQSRIQRARLDELDSWVDAVLDAPSVEALLGRANPAPNRARARPKARRSR